MWDFSDPVVYMAIFTVGFGISLLIFLYFWVRKNIASDSKGNGSK